MNCSICLKEIKENNKVKTDCNHLFHLTCILNNFKINNYSGENCPICRTSLFAVSTDNQPVSQRYVMAPIRRAITVPFRYSWPPGENTNMLDERYNYQIFSRLKARRYNITDVERSRQLTNYAYLIVSKYSFHKLKEKLGLYGLSRRGYRRYALEDRLIDYMVLDTTGLFV